MVGPAIIAFFGMLISCDVLSGQERLTRRDVEIVMSFTDSMPAEYERKLLRLLAEPSLYCPELVDILRTTTYPSTQRAVLRLLARIDKGKPFVAPAVRECFSREWTAYTANPKDGPHQLIAAIEALENVGTADDIESLMSVVKGCNREAIQLRRTVLSAIVALADLHTPGRLASIANADRGLEADIQEAIEEINAKHCASIKKE